MGVSFESVAVAVTVLTLSVAVVEVALALEPLALLSPDATRWDVALLVEVDTAESALVLLSAVDEAMELIFALLAPAAGVEDVWCSDGVVAAVDEVNVGAVVEGRALLLAT